MNKYISKIGFRNVVLMACMAAVTASAGLPDRSKWQASASSGERGEFPAQAAIDGNHQTRWSSAFADGEWIEINLGQPAILSGAVLLWETAYPSGYRIDLSEDGKQWDTVYQTRNSNGGRDWVLFRKTAGQYLRVICEQRATGWGNSIWELELLGAEDAPSISCVPSASGGDAILDGNPDTSWKLPKSDQGVEIIVDLKQNIDLGGIRLEWKEGGFQKIALDHLLPGGAWQQVAATARGRGEMDALLHPATSTEKIRIRFQSPIHPDSSLNDIHFYGGEEALDPLRVYEFAASRSRPGLYPDALRQRQVYWTVCGWPGEHHESLFDEYGNVEPYTGGPQFMPYLEINGHILSALDADTITHRLEEGWKPMPSVIWSYGQIEVTAEAHAAPFDEEGRTWVRYRVKNQGDGSVEGRFHILLRPVQINPKWQHGGISEIRKIQYAKSSEGATLTWNDDRHAFITPAPDKHQIANFESGDIMEELAYRAVPASPDAVPFGLLSSAASYSLVLEPGEEKTVFIVLPMQSGDTLKNLQHWTEDQISSFHGSSREAVSSFWTDKIEHVKLSVHEERVTETLKSQLAYILINQDGPAIQPGSRNYNRTWMRDGSITSTALMRMGLEEEARSYLSWYAKRIYPSGMVPPILYTDGSIYHGYGGDIEYDSQGQFIYAAMEIWRLTGDDAFLSEMEESIFDALRFLETLRRQTLEPQYMESEKQPERFRGILPASISHEGYSTPHHSYWDVFWALKGWRDGALAARTLGRNDRLDWIQSEEMALSEGLHESLRAVMDFYDLSTLPASAERGDSDPTSIAIALSPCDVGDVLPEQALHKTFEDYVHHIQQRKDVDWTGKYTPYEIRNVTALQKLGMRKEAVQLHDILMDDRRPPAWNQFAEVVMGQSRKGSYIGDMPHTWVGSGYIHAVRNMLVREVENHLILFEGAPARWFLKEGVRLENLPTASGVLSLSAKMVDGALRVKLSGLNGFEGEIRIHDPVNSEVTSRTVEGEHVNQTHWLGKGNM